MLYPVGMTYLFLVLADYVSIQKYGVLQGPLSRVIYFTVSLPVIVVSICFLCFFNYWIKKKKNT
jgi:hypothetical protein